MKSQTVEMDFLGQKIILKSEGDADTIHESLDLAALRIKDVERRLPGAPAHQVALLALLDVCEEYVKAKRRATEHKRKLEKRAADLLSLMDAGLK
jgi:hypothetical protein